MILRRARIAFIAAIVLSALVIATEVPIGQLVSERSTIASASAELATLRGENKSLASQIRGLQQGSTIEQIAHQDYGLIEPGESSIVVMPGGGSSDRVDGRSSETPLGSETIPKSDLVPSDAALSPPRSATDKGSGGGGGFWQRFLGRLEFWKASA